MAVHRVLYQSTLNAKLIGRKKLGRERCTSNRDDLGWVDWSWSQCIESHHAQTSSWEGLPSYFWNRNNVRSSLPGLRGKKELDCSSVVQSPLFRYKYILNFIWKSISGVWRGTESKLTEVQCEISEVSDDLWCRDICWCWSIVLSSPKSTVYLEIFEHFMHLSVDKLYGDADFLFQQDFSTCPQCQNHLQVVCGPWY